MPKLVSEKLSRRLFFASTVGSLFGSLVARTAHARNAAYLYRLQALPLAEREQLLKGNWKIDQYDGLSLAS